MSTQVERRLAAVLAADVVGYTRLMEADEEATLAAWWGARKEVIDPGIAAHGGRIVKHTGDGFLAEFGTVVEAVRCATEMQQGLAAAAIDFRMGINLGDIVADDEDIYGDGVNLAARIEALADPGGICISSSVYDQVHKKLDLGFEDCGEHRLKNVSTPVRVFKVRPVGSTAKAVGDANLEQEIRFCTSSDGVGLAYASVGSGPPLVKSANWLNHLEYDWESPIWRHVLRDLAAHHRLVRYDARGSGLSDREVSDFSLESRVADLEAVVDAAGLERFALLGISQGCAVSIAFAARQPERISHLVLYGGYLRGRNHRGSVAAAGEAEALETLIHQGWGQENPAFRQVFTSLFVPDGSAEQMQWFNDLMRITATPETATLIWRALNEIEVSDLAQELSVPTLVLHCREDAIVPFEEGRRMAATIPGARFVALEGRNHLILEHEPAWKRFLAEVEGFLASE
ncbi:MAG: alpha/beta fold hydrolase [Alphaproteobacteria bacterium]|nr:alpha/beta fold hydrolase [Alphaproteobacteria bacterium]